MTFFNQSNLHGDVNIGLYGFATDKYCICGAWSEKIKQALEETLKVKLYNFNLFGIDFLKIFCAGNSNGIIMTQLIPRDDLSIIKKRLPINIYILKTDFAIGNMIIMNDNGIIISPVIKKDRKQLEDYFGIECVVSTIAGLNVIGSLAVATNRGCLAHPEISEKETKTIEDILKIKVEIGTVNFGSSYPGSGVIANSNGFITSKQTSGHELGRITEALGFL